MLSDFNTRYVLYLFLISIGAITFHRLGAFDIEMSLLDKVSENIQYGGFSEDSSELSFSEETPSTTCNIKFSSGDKYCGVTIILREEKGSEQGRDLSIYNSVEIEVKTESSNKRPLVRFSLRNFNNNYSKLDDYVTNKFNSVTFAPSDYEGSISVPLNAFQVEEWWIEQYKISFDDAQLDFTNVHYAELLTHDFNQDGEHTITVTKAIFTGELITETELLQIILILWLAFIILLISAQKNRLQKVSTTDSLTKLMNRRGITYWVTKNFPSFSIGSPLTMFYFDLDDFKKINDSYGHMVGDELLCKFSDKISLTVKNSPNTPAKYMFSRLSGDEFCLVFKGLEQDNAEKLAFDMFSEFSEGLFLSCGAINISMSLGIATSDPETNTFESLLTHADSAMYHAKKRGKNQFKIFDESVSQDIQFRKQVAEKVRTALQENEFTLKFMPIYHVNSLKIYGAEVLLRCEAANLKGIGPDVFIPIAEEFDIIKEIDLWVIEATFKKLAQNTPFFTQYPLVICINFSSIELHNRNFTRDLKKLLNKYQIDPQFIEMEITETSLVETDELSISILNDIRNLGIKLALDDFGTGYTAFNQLMNYPVDCLKIDKSFIDDLLLKKESKNTMLKAIFSIAKAYKLKTIAEGVEFAEQYQYINERGCDFVQGYLFSKPLNWSKFVEEVSKSEKTNLNLS